MTITIKKSPTWTSSRRVRFSGAGGGNIRSYDKPFAIADLDTNIINYWDVNGTMSLDGSNRIASWTASLGRTDSIVQANSDYKPYKTASSWSSGISGITPSDDQFWSNLNMSYNPSVIPQPWTRYFVHKGATGTAKVIFERNYSVPVQMRLSTSLDGYVYAGGTLNMPAVSSGEHVYCVIFNGASSAVYVDDPETPYATGNAGNSGNEGICVGNSSTAAKPVGAMGDFLDCRSAHNLANRTAVMNFFRTKFILP